MSHLCCQNSKRTAKLIRVWSLSCSVDEQNTSCLSMRSMNPTTRFSSRSGFCNVNILCSIAVRSSQSVLHLLLLLRYWKASFTSIAFFISQNTEFGPRSTTCSTATCLLVHSCSLPVKKNKRMMTVLVMLIFVNL